MQNYFVAPPAASVDAADPSISHGKPATPDAMREKLKQMFPNCRDTRLRAALIIHSGNLAKAADFIRADIVNGGDLDNIVEGEGYTFQ